WQQNEENDGSVAVIEGEPTLASPQSSLSSAKRVRVTPSKTPRVIKKPRVVSVKQTSTRRSITKVSTQYPCSKTVVTVSAQSEAEDGSASCSEECSALPFSDGTNDDTESVISTSTAMLTTLPSLPATYSIIFDNLDFYIKTHHQSSMRTNTSLHWIHHVAVEDRVQINHLSNIRPITDITNYDLACSLPGQDTQNHIRREFTVLGSRILTEHLDVFKGFDKYVVHHMPHEYSDAMAERSTDHPLGLLFKNENKTADLVDVLQYIQKEYVPMGPGGISTVLVGGDRLTEGNSRNIQWAFADGATKEDRLEGMVFMFEDWHTIRNLLQIHYKIFFKKTSAKDHGTLFANMNTLRCSNAKQGPGPAYSAYKDVMKKDTTALFLAAAMEHFGLNDVTDNPSDFISENVKTGTPEEKREWLHQKAADVVDTFVMQSHLMDTCNAATGNTDIICRKEGCGKLGVLLHTIDNCMGLTAIPPSSPNLLK
ncbi:hypothetical protein WMY93_032854, partial [Mugilogobius chulae]